MDSPQFVPRPTLVIGDLHGSLEALEKNLKGAKAVDSEGNWKHKDRDVVFLGDAICDRGADDLEVAALINDLRAQVRAAGGTCITLAGNHEITGFCFLSGDMSHLNIGPNFERQNCGIKILASVVRGFRGFGSLSALVEERKDRNDFLEQFKSSHQGREVIRYYCNLDLYAVQGQVLFTHTPATPEMLRSVLEEGERVNATFTKVIQRVLDLRGAENFTELEGKGFAQMERAFLSNSNRQANVPTPDDPLWQKCKEAGIEAHVFGHDHKSRGLWPTHPTVKLLGLDNHYTRPEGSKKCSAAWLYPNGEIQNFDY